MDTDLSQGMNQIYSGGQSRHYPGYPNHAQYGESQQSATHTLPPIQPQPQSQPQRQAYAHPPQPYETMGRQSQHPGQGMTYQSYGSPNVSQAPYASSMSQYSQSPYAQAPHQMSLSNDYQGSSSHLPNLRPMPPGSAGGGAQQYSMQPMHDQDYQNRTHVVGSQGRRGILPSDEGRPSAPLATTSGSTPKAAAIPPKDAEGKYPCPHCTKTYLHAKHLKRHLLRHTGDRPYSCALCSDTFSRSDILKRHFQKCSIRRGNPTGATHLSNSQSHLKKQQAKKAAISTAGESNFPTAPQTPTSASFGEGAGLGMSHIPSGNNAQVLSSRSDHDRQYDEARRSMNGAPGYGRGGLPHSAHNSLPSSGSSTPLTSRVPNGLPQSYTPDSTHTRVGSFSQNYQHNTNPTRHSMPQMHNPSHLDSGFDWASLQHSRDNNQLPSPVHHEGPMRNENDTKLHYSQLDQNGELLQYFPRENGAQNEGINNWMGRIH